jgi:hypothetical protein
VQRNALRLKYKQHSQLPGFLGAPPEQKKADDKPVAVVSKFDSLRAQRRAKGECFKCGEKYSPTHKCPDKVQLHVLEEILESLQIEEPQPEQFKQCQEQLANEVCAYRDKWASSQHLY